MNQAAKVEMIPIAKIQVINARVRSKVKFKEIIANIATVGLKKPITVSRRAPDDGGYDLVCGQGRLEAYIARGATEIPALVVDIPLEERLLWSLIENLARRKRTHVELARAILVLKERGHGNGAIAEKIGLSETYVAHLLRLIENGEERLVDAVERGTVPVSVAIQIAACDDAATQRSMQEAYESGKLRGRALLRVRRLIEERRVRGKGMRTGSRSSRKAPSPQDLVRALRKETQKHELLVKRAHICEHFLMFVLSALRDLRGDEGFVTLLRAEKLDEMPKHLYEALVKS